MPWVQAMNLQQVELYLCSLLKQPVTIDGLVPLRRRPGETEVKGYGYGTPVRVDYRTAERERRSAVIHTMDSGPFGHEHMADRAQILLWQNRAFNSLPRHVRALDVAGVGTEGELTSLGRVDECCLVTEYLEGEPYARDLQKILMNGATCSCDIARADALTDYLVTIHKNPVNEPGLYARRIRELVGHGECLMGLTDSYAEHCPDHPFITAEGREDIEHLAVKWRWGLKGRAH